jgi:DMSO reductase anchor subunit
LRGLFRLRAGLTLGGAALLGLAVVSAPSLAGALALLALPLLLGGELVERHLFFTAEAARSMPGA